MTNALGPDKRITPTPPLPGGVAIAAIVSIAVVQGHYSTCVLSAMPFLLAIVKPLLGHR